MGKVGLDHFFMCLKFKDLSVKYEPNKYAIIKIKLERILILEIL